MDPQTTNRVLLALTFGYGLTLAILGWVDSSAVGPVAVVGALVLGAGWALRGMLSGRGRDRGQ